MNQVRNMAQQKSLQDIFSDYKKIMNPEMIKLAYYNGKMVGFYISLPNYNNLIQETIANQLKGMTY